MVRTFPSISESNQTDKIWPERHALAVLSNRVGPSIAPFPDGTTENTACGIADWFTCTGNTVTSIRILRPGRSGADVNAVDFGELTHLTTLDFGTVTNLGPLPTTINLLTNLVIFNASYNAFSAGDLSIFQTLSHLQYLQIAGCGLTGGLSALSAMTGLTTLILNHNSLAGNTDALWSLSSLTQVNLNDNSLSGRIANPLPSNLQLTNLTMARNLLTGPLTMISNLTTLWTLDLSSNSFYGSVPSLASTTLRNVSFAFNNLTSFDQSWTSPSTLQIANFSFNALTGIIPTIPDNVAVSYANNTALRGLIPFASGNRSSMLKSTCTHMQSSNRSSFVPRYHQYPDPVRCQ